MRFKDNRLSFGKSTRTAILLVIVAAVTLEATSLFQGVFSRKTLQAEMSMRAESRLSLIKSEIMDVINQAEAAVRNKRWIAQWSLDHPDSLANVGQMLVRDNPVIVGSTVALVPGYDRQRPLLSPYTYRNGDSLITRSLATPAYDYPSREWFTKPLELGEGYWSEPYVDTGGGEMLMTTYSLPIYDETGNAAAVLTGDISLDWLTDLVTQLQVYPHSRTIMLSRAGLFMVSPREDVVMSKTVNDVVGGLQDSLSFQALNRAMLEGRSGQPVLPGLEPGHAGRQVRRDDRPDQQGETPRLLCARRTYRMVHVRHHPRERHLQRFAEERPADQAVPGFGTDHAHHPSPGVRPEPDPEQRTPPAKGKDGR